MSYPQLVFSFRAKPFIIRRANYHPIGEELTVRCDSVNKKGNSSFTIEGMEARFDPALKVEKGTEVLARIVRTEMKPKKAYILERVQKD